MTRAQSCFLRKAFSSRWASPRLVTWKGMRGEAASLFRGRRTTNSSFLEPHKDNGHLAKDPCPSPATGPRAKLNPVRDDSVGTGEPVRHLAFPQDGCDHVKKKKQEQGLQVPPVPALPRTLGLPQALLTGRHEVRAMALPYV